MNILKELRTRFANVLGDFTDEPWTFAQMVMPSGDAKFGDFQANCAMPLAKHNGTNPRELAAKIVDRLNVTDICTPPEIAGPGFINLSLKDDWLQHQINLAANDSHLGVDLVAEPKNVVIDFSSPNVAKPMHVGHLRSSVIGDALQRVIKFLGHNVTTDNHIGDWGTQFGMIIYGYKHFVDQDLYKQNPVGELARLYRLVNQLSDYHTAQAELPKKEHDLQKAIADLQTQSATPDSDPKAQQKSLKKLQQAIEQSHDSIKSLKAKIQSVADDAELKSQAQEHPSIARLAREETAKLHAGDDINQQLWSTFLPQCLQALNTVYERLGITFDHTLGESFYNPYLADTVQELAEKGLAIESHGAKCVFIEGNAAPFIIQKADGAYTYATTDLATIRYRVNEFDADVILYIVDSRQAEHFKLLFQTAQQWGYTNVECHFISFGTVMGNDNKPFKTRSGDNVGLESLLAEAVSKAREIVAANDDAKTDAAGNVVPELDETTRDRIAEVVGIGGIKYADLHHNRESDYVFDWDKMLAKTGDTATYMQYAYARIYGIFRKGNIDLDALKNSQQPILLSEPAERALALKLCRFGESLESVASEFRPNLLTQYLYELANELTTFYGQCHVLNADDEAVKESRLRLILMAGNVIHCGLNLLGIAAVEKM